MTYTYPFSVNTWLNVANNWYLWLININLIVFRFYKKDSITTYSLPYHIFFSDTWPISYQRWICYASSVVLWDKWWTCDVFIIASISIVTLHHWPVPSQIVYRASVYISLASAASSGHWMTTHWPPLLHNSHISIFTQNHKATQWHNWNTVLGDVKLISLTHIILIYDFSSTSPFCIISLHIHQLLDHLRYTGSSRVGGIIIEATLCMASEIIKIKDTTFVFRCSTFDKATLQQHGNCSGNHKELRKSIPQQWNTTQKFNWVRHRMSAGFIVCIIYFKTEKPMHHFTI